ncbi:uncharacterized protein BT62DRAFT_1078972 [Guyanagaster necrorhizus]|uniref:BAH domain-containing protein n=1 Tax=Guyanagaster necrorhizus TaxID=856835 RepID=A0A9P7VN11_9AGAR|nr:uncharacterized protein BT62DRAFT_1078972 [Guyanagaster necrorhizus MCA 3950]KAG7442874.1 hypothetical protein BT62DRAFT_1078972 [Guyanagaster necrorhizus MCA 3950]
MARRRRRLLFTHRKSSRAAERQLGGDPDAPSKAQFMSWSKFARFVMPDVGGVDHEIKVNDDVLVWPQGRLINETLKMDDYWVAKVRDIRSSEEQHEDVWVRVQWYYSPRDVADVIKYFNAELCGQHERIFSDHYDYIHSTTIDGLATIKGYSDIDMEQDVIEKDSYWCRYTFEREARTLEPKPTKSCICHHPYDPDDDTVVMHFCPRPGCRKAYHQSCLVKEKFKEPVSLDRPLRLLLSSPDSDEPFVVPVKQSTRSKRAAAKRTIEELLTELPNELVRVAKQPIVKGAKYPLGGIVGNVTWVVTARRLVYDALSGFGVPDDWKGSIDCSKAIVKFKDNNVIPAVICPQCEGPI